MSWQSRHLPIITSTIDTQLLRRHPISRTLIGSIRFVPGRGVLFDNLVRGFRKVYPVPSTKYTLTPTGQYACWDITIPEADSTDYAFTTAGFCWQIWFHVFAEPGNNEFPEIFSRHVYVNESNNQGWSTQVTAANAAAPKRMYCGVYNNNGSANYQLTGNAVVAGNTYCLGFISQNVGGQRQLVTNDTAGAGTGGNNACAASSGAGIYLGNHATTAHIGFIKANLYSAFTTTAQMSAAYQNFSDIYSLPPIPQGTSHAARNNQVIFAG